MIDQHIDCEVPGFGELAHTPREALGYAEALMSLSPAAYWTFGETMGTQLADQTGSHPLALSGDYTLGRPPASPAADDGAVRLFEGSATAGDAVLPGAAGAAFSIVFWVRRLVPGAVGRFLSQYDVAPPGRTSLTLRADGRIRYFLDGDPVLHSTAATLESWTHGVLTRDTAGKAQWYLNGQPDTSQLGHGLAVADLPFVLGEFVTLAAEVELDEVAVFHSALSAGQVAWLYRTATGQPAPALEG